MAGKGPLRLDHPRNCSGLNCYSKPATHYWKGKGYCVNCLTLAKVDYLEQIMDELLVHFNLTKPEKE
jgi:hypothetical protein